VKPIFEMTLHWNSDIFPNSMWQTWLDSILYRFVNCVRLIGTRRNKQKFPEVSGRVNSKTELGYIWPKQQQRL